MAPGGSQNQSGRRGEEKKQKFVPSRNPTTLRRNKSVQSGHFYAQSVYNSRCLFTVKCYGSQPEVWLLYCISTAPRQYLKQPLCAEC